MSDRRLSAESDAGQSAAGSLVPPGRPQRYPNPPPLDLIECDGCGRRFATADGAAVLSAIKGSCPTCGGRFRLCEPEE